MKNWKSTLLGALLAASDLLLEFLKDPNFDWTNWQNWLRPLLFAALGYFVADARKATHLSMIFLVFGFLLPSCAESPFKLATKYGTITQDKEGGITARSKIVNLHRGPDGVLTIRPKAKTLTINPDK